MEIGSLASRYFRTNASLKGIIRDNRVFIGYGLGNAIIPLRSGYDEALEEYKSSYVNEINQLIKPEYIEDSVSFCLYTRIISEFGLIFLVVSVTYLYKLSRKSNDFWLKNYIWILFYIYIQFESYAFYTIWLYIVLLKLNIEKEQIQENKKEEEI